MRILLIFSALLIGILGAEGQTTAPKLRSGNGAITYQYDNGPKSAWNLSTELDPDILEVSVYEGSTVKVTFATDQESLSFNVEGGKNYDFIILKDSVAYNTRISGKSFNSSDLRLHRLFNGTEANARPRLHGRALSFSSGTSFDSQNLIDQVRGCADCPAKLDVVLIDLRLYTGPVFWLQDSLAKRKLRGDLNKIATLEGINSVEAFLVKRLEDLGSAEVISSISNAEVVLFTGTSLPCYLPKDIAAQDFKKAMKDVYERGGGIGGSLFGQEINGAVVFDDCDGVVSSLNGPAVLNEPYNEEITFAEGFLNWPIFQNTSLLSSNYSTRGYFPSGTLEKAFVLAARQIQDGKKSSFHLIVPISARFLIDAQGVAKVTDGQGAVYFITADHKPEVCRKGQPLTYSKVKIWRIKPGETYNLKNRPKVGYYTVSVKEGKLDKDPY